MRLPGEAPAAMRWMRVDAEPPDKDAECLFYGVFNRGNEQFSKIFVGTWHGKGTRFYSGYGIDVKGRPTHWTPLPAPPEKEASG